MSAIPVLYTPRLILRPFTLADAARVQELAGDERVAQHTARMPHPYPDGLAEKWIQPHQLAAGSGQAFTFAITLAGTRTPGRELDPADTGHLIGSVEIRTLPEATSAELGYWIGVPWWDKGFATEAARAVIDFAFARRGYLRVLASHFVQNPASGRVLQKRASFPPVRPRANISPSAPDRFDLVHYALTRETWSRSRVVHRWKPAAQPALAAT